MTINIAQPNIGDDEIVLVNQVLQSGMLAQGPKVAQLEENFANYCGTKYAVMVNSGTAAIHSALFALGLGPGDEVITTPFSFIATVNPIIMLGAKPVFVDIDPETYLIDVSKIEKAITKKTKAIIPVHLYGQPIDSDELLKIAKKYSISIIEDACQSVGAEYKSKKAGNLGNAGCFSLYATKNIMCGEGGVVTTNDKSLADSVKRFRQHGMSGQYQYQHIGYNYRSTDLCAAIAIEQLKKVDIFNQKRQSNAKFLDENLSSINGIILPKVLQDRSHVYHQYTVKLTDEFPLSRQEFINKLKEKDINAGVYYPLPLHTIDHISKYGYSFGDFTITEEICNKVVSLPVHPMVSEENLEYIVNTIKGLIK